MAKNYTVKRYNKTSEVKKTTVYKNMLGDSILEKGDLVILHIWSDTRRVWIVLDHNVVGWEMNDEENETPEDPGDIND